MPMTEDQLRRLRAGYHALLEQQAVFSDPQVVKEGVVESGTFFILRNEVAKIAQDFPGQLPAFNEQNFFSHQGQHQAYFNVSAIRSYLASAVGRLKVMIDTPQAAPVTQSREFSFVRDPQLRELLERDYGEIQQAYIAKCWKSVIVLSGGAMEAILTDVLQHDANRAKAAKKAPKQADITKWDLSDLINVSVELNRVSPGVEKLSHPVREYRNLIHPGNEIRTKLTFGAEEAKIALEVLHILHRDLSG